MNKDDCEAIVREVVTSIGEIDSNDEMPKYQNFIRQPQVQSNIVLVIQKRRILKSLITR